MVTHEEEITVYQAIHEMRRLTQLGQLFSFVHATYDRDRQISHGIRQVRRAMLRPSARGDDVSFADLKLFYHDEDLNADRICWQPLIMFFEGKRCILN